MKKREKNKKKHEKKESRLPLVLSLSNSSVFYETMLKFYCFLNKLMVGHLCTVH